MGDEIKKEIDSLKKDLKNMGKYIAKQTDGLHKKMDELLTQQYDSVKEIAVIKRDQEHDRKDIQAAHDKLKEHSTEIKTFMDSVNSLKDFSRNMVIKISITVVAISTIVGVVTKFIN